MVSASVFLFKTLKNMANIKMYCRKDDSSVKMQKTKNQPSFVSSHLSTLTISCAECAVQKVAVPRRRIQPRTFILSLFGRGAIHGK